MTELFVYGTLMDPNMVLTLLGRVVPFRKATVTGFRRVRTPALPYPFAVPEDGTELEGVVLEGLTDVEMATLDTYERVSTRLFVRQEVNVEGRPACIYVGGPTLVRRYG